MWNMVSAMKSTVNEIRQRFDADVERFSNLDTGQSATVDAPLAMALIAQAAAVTTPQARHVLDVGCGAGNYTLKLLERLPNLDVTLIDLSQPMLDRARERVSRATTGVSRPSGATFERSNFLKGSSTSCWPLLSFTTCVPTRSGGKSSQRSTGGCGLAARYGYSIWSRVRSLRSRNSCASSTAST